MTPVEAVFSFFATAFDFVFSLFLRLLSASGATGVYIAVFTIYCVSRFLVVPLLGNKDSSKVGDD